MNNEVFIIFYELRSNPSDDWGVEEVCAESELANKEVEKLTARFPGYKFYMMDYEVIK